MNDPILAENAKLTRIVDLAFARIAELENKIAYFEKKENAEKKEAEHWMELLGRLASSVPEGGDAGYSIEDIKEAVKESKLLYALMRESEECNIDISISIGRKLAKLVGCEFYDEAGRLFEFRRRRMSSGTRYRVVFLAAAPEPHPLSAKGSEAERKILKLLAGAGHLKQFSEQTKTILP